MRAALGRLELDALILRLGPQNIWRKRVLLQGAGEGAELGFWTSYRPRLLAGVDLFPVADSGAPMVQSDVQRMPIASASVDVLASINAFEHFNDVEAAIAETARVLRPGGRLLASFGPLWHAFGGDHFSSVRGGLDHAYDHLLLDESTYGRWVDAMTVPGLDEVDGSPVEGLLYIRQGLFSKITAGEYRRLFDRYLTIDRFVVETEPATYAFRQQHPGRWGLLLERYPEEDLLATRLVIQARKVG